MGKGSFKRRVEKARCRLAGNHRLIFSYRTLGALKNKKYNLVTCKCGARWKIERED